MLHLQAFILSNPENFRELLKLPPYCIDTKEDEHTVLFKYNQIESDFNLELVRECRGIILYKKNWMIACHPFHKFGNYGEGYAPDIDWNSAKVMEKLDGSLIKAWFNKVNSKWQWSTNGTLKGKVSVNKDGKRIYIDLDDLSKYLNQGYSKGYPKKEM